MARLENRNGNLESNTIPWSFSKVEFFFCLHQEDYWKFYLNKLWEFQILDLKSETAAFCKLIFHTARSLKMNQAFYLYLE